MSSLEVMPDRRYNRQAEHPDINVCRRVRSQLNLLDDFSIFHIDLINETTETHFLKSSLSRKKFGAL